MAQLIATRITREHQSTSDDTLSGRCVELWYDHDDPDGCASQPYQLIAHSYIGSHSSSPRRVGEYETERQALDVLESMPDARKQPT